jgi:hypothetical protein
LSFNCWSFVNPLQEISSLLYLSPLLLQLHKVLGGMIAFRPKWRHLVVCNTICKLNLAWIQFMLHKEIFYVQGLVWPLWFFSCHIVDPQWWIGQTQASNAVFAQFYQFYR